MSARWIALVLGALLLSAVSSAVAEPIMKPRKYYGPIPQSMVWLRGGFYDGASNEEMNAYLDGLVQDPFTETINDFGAAFLIDAGYGHKPHPQFGVRINAGVSFLSSEANGNKDPEGSTVDTLVVDYAREFKVELIVVELSGIYFLSDAAVKEFQSYIGGGFSVGFPRESFEETQVDIDTGQYIQTIESSEWGGMSAGVHGVLGAIYYLTNTFGITTEGRVQLMEGKYDQLQAPNEVNELEDVSFVVDYTGFYITVGVLWGF